MTQGATPPTGGYPTWLPQADPHLPLQPGLTSTPPAIDDFRPPRSRLPWIVGLVAAIVVGLLLWTLQGQLASQPAPTTSPTTQAATPAPSQPGAPFTLPDGSSGRWRIESTTWDDAGVTVNVHIWLDAGQLTYKFESISNAGGIFGNPRDVVTPPQLRRGSLTSGQSVSGNVAFDLPRGTATLLLETMTGDAVAALDIKA